MNSTLVLQQETIPIIKSSLAMKRRALEFSLQKYSKRLAAFEQRYGMDSEEFVSRFEAGELGDEPDWFEWQYLLDAHRETQRQLKLLSTIRL